MKYSMKENKLSNAEKLVMKVIWDAKEPVTCREVADTLRINFDHDYADTTVHTFLKNIKNKGFLTKQKNVPNRYQQYIKGVNLFEASRDKEGFLKEELKDFIDLWFDGNKNKFKSFMNKL